MRQIPKEAFMPSETLEEANWRLHIYAAEHNRQLREQAWLKLTERQRQSMLASGYRLH